MWLHAFFFERPYDARAFKCRLLQLAHALLANPLRYFGACLKKQKIKLPVT